MSKLTKKEFLALVDLAIAVHGPIEVFAWGASEKFHYIDSLDNAVIEYYFWTHHSEGSPRVPGDSKYPNWYLYAQEILNHWTEG